MAARQSSTAQAIRPARAPRRRGRPLNLALQGGGAHGAFTWGVLDRLLEDGGFECASISGTSAGAVNAAVMAAGLMDGGPETARERLAAVWREIARVARFGPLQAGGALGPTPGGEAWSPGAAFFEALSRMLSPYQFNPLDFNPLRQVLEAHVDFAALAERSPVDLFLSATDVATGKVRVFRTGEVSVEVVLASACLPHLQQAVKVGQRHYWDGGYTANPAVLPLVWDGGSDDTLIVQLNPSEKEDVPTNVQDIYTRLNAITFNAPLRREVELIEQCRAMARDSVAFGGRLHRRLRRHRFHLIEAAEYTRDLSEASKLRPDWGLISRLHEGGRHTTEAWLEHHGETVGHASSVDLAEKFL